MTRTEIRFAGSGGQGLILAARILFVAMGIEGCRASQSQSYEPTSRGGFCYSDVIVSDDPSDYPLTTGLDVAVLLDQVGADRSTDLIKPSALVIFDERLVPRPPEGSFEVHSLPITARAVAIGSTRIANMVALGAAVQLSGLCAFDSLDRAVAEETPKRFAELNLRAAREGYDLARAQAAPPRPTERLIT